MPPRPRPIASALLVLLVGAGTYAAGCAHGDEATFDGAPALSGGSDGSATHPQSTGDDSGGLVLGDATIVSDAGADGATLSDASGAVADAAQDVAVVPDGASFTDAAPVDAGPRDAGPPDTGAPDAALSPILGLPDPSGATCSDIGQDTDCPLDEVCLIATPDSGRCEGCVACHGYQHYCKKSADCARPYQCYANACAYICHLGGHECGSGTCIDVGNGTYGICKP